jgi:Ankyrin repeats (3 copies)/Protein kinase domain
MLRYRRVFALMVEQGVDVNAVNECGESALFAACKLGREQAAACLLMHGADPSALNGDGHSLLAMAVANGKKSLVALLLKHGATLSNPPLDDHALLLAERLSRRDLTRLMLLKDDFRPHLPPPAVIDERILVGEIVPNPDASPDELMRGGHGLAEAENFAAAELVRQACMSKQKAELAAAAAAAAAPATAPCASVVVVPAAASVASAVAPVKKRAHRRTRSIGVSFGWNVIGNSTKPELEAVDSIAASAATGEPAGGQHHHSSSSSSDVITTVSRKRDIDAHPAKKDGVAHLSAARSGGGGESPKLLALPGDETGGERPQHHRRHVSSDDSDRSHVDASTSASLSSSSSSAAAASDALSDEHEGMMRRQSVPVLVDRNAHLQRRSLVRVGFDLETGEKVAVRTIDTSLHRLRSADVTRLKLELCFRQPRRPLPPRMVALSDNSARKIHPALILWHDVIFHQARHRIYIVMEYADNLEPLFERVHCDHLDEMREQRERRASGGGDASGDDARHDDAAHDSAGDSDDSADSADAVAADDAAAAAECKRAASAMAVSSSGGAAMLTPRGASDAHATGSAVSVALSTSPKAQPLTLLAGTPSSLPSPSDRGRRALKKKQVHAQRKKSVWDVKRERLARGVMMQLVDAMRFVHDMTMLNRDALSNWIVYLQPEHVCLQRVPNSDGSKSTRVRISRLGFALTSIYSATSDTAPTTGVSSAQIAVVRMLDLTRSTRSTRAFISYTAPEQLDLRKRAFVFGQSLDAWALGVLFYFLLSHRLPFADHEDTLSSDSSRKKSKSSSSSSSSQASALPPPEVDYAFLFLRISLGLYIDPLDLFRQRYCRDIDAMLQADPLERATFHSLLQKFQ